MSKKVLILAAMSLLVASCSEDSGSGGGLDYSSCGNGLIDAGETCDDRNVVSGDGCSSTCQIEPGYTCQFVGTACTRNGGSDDPIVGPVDEPVTTTGCGNGVIDPEEKCDDGNLKGGDGCSADCKTLEDGFDCKVVGNRTFCSVHQESVCGDGFITGNEVCDDSNDTDGDGCSSDCMTIENGYRCPEAGYDCIPSGCGDGLLDEESEECDDGLLNVDYTDIPGACSTSCHRAHYCGDGLLDTVDMNNGEECDTGSEDTANDYNGCAQCRRVNYCGDGKKTHDEQCDDGNTNSGDGCSKDCTMEENFICTIQNGKSVCMPVNCGNGKLDENETCDDGNRVAGDGCSANCQLEKGYAFVDDGHGGKMLKRVCGDGIIQNLLNGEKCKDTDTTCEACDDGNLESGDGCSDVCTVEAGFICPDAGKPCVARSCGDGIVAKGEECDDGVDPVKNIPVSGDGCSDRCKIEVGYHCPTAGKPCVKGKCGDGIIDAGETCDEGSAKASGGCVNCQILKGWKCDEPGKTCESTKCGDGILEGIEECEEKSEGCVDCQIQTGYHCDLAGTHCVKGKCGDNIVDVGEECDDGNQRAGDGCDPLCKIEAIFECIEDTCRPICGDGLTMWEYGEECDDGNLISGDGCSSQCKIERGFTCTDFKQKDLATIRVPITYRDFRGYDEHGTGDGYATQDVVNLNKTCFKLGYGHPDIENVSGGTNRVTGLVLNDLDEDGKPVWTKKTGGHIHCAESFSMWYRDVPGMNQTFQDHLELKQDRKDKNVYVYENNNFFPLNGKGYGNSHSGKNFGFTSELSTYFKFNGGEKLEFFGDDDVWVFVNGKLAVDIGGIHEKTTGNVELKTTKHSGGDQWVEQYGIFAGGIYSIKLFQAERHVTESNYKLTLSGFVNMGASTCTSICGDGIIAGNEECDYKTDNLDDVAQQKANGCNHCKLAPSCGNGKLERGEECDVDEKWCVNCKLDPATCGNGKLDEHEQCDGKAGVSDGQVCLDTCRLSGCGDGYVDASIGEECDDGNQSDDDSCTTKCKAPYCGDGVVSNSLGEVCDDGINDGSYGGCGIGCSYVPPRCGDGVIDKAEGEECDDGVDDNVGGYGRCTNECKLDIRCGDGVVQEEFEQCDPGLDKSCNSNCQRPIN